MKNLVKLLVLVILGVVITLFVVSQLAAYIPSNEKCQSVWDQMDVESGNEGMIVNLILNREHAPDSVGATLQECIRKGWDGWR